MCVAWNLMLDHRKTHRPVFLQGLCLCTLLCSVHTSCMWPFLCPFWEMWPAPWGHLFLLAELTQAALNVGSVLDLMVDVSKYKHPSMISFGSHVSWLSDLFSWLDWKISMIVILHLSLKCGKQWSIFILLCEYPINSDGNTNIKAHNYNKSILSCLRHAGVSSLSC